MRRRKPERSRLAPEKPLRCYPGHMIGTQSLTLLQLAVVLVGAAAIWRWPHHALSVVVVVMAACFAATGLSDTANWRAYLDPILFMAAVAFVLWTWRRVREAHRRDQT